MGNEDLSNPEPLDGPAPVERVILQEEVKLFEIKTLLAQLSSSVYDLSNLPSLSHDLVPVFSEDDKKLGFASLYIEDNAIYAAMAIDFSSEERLLIETGEKLYARFYGRIGVPGSKYMDLQKKLSVTKLIVDGIVLTREGTSYLLPLKGEATNG